jgi:hypothetical protein
MWWAVIPYCGSTELPDASQMAEATDVTVLRRSPPIIGKTGASFPEKMQMGTLSSGAGHPLTPVPWVRGWTERNGIRSVGNAAGFTPLAGSFAQALAANQEVW